MGIALALVVAACVVVAASCIYLAWHPDYKCGPLGVIGLGSLCLAGVSRGTLIVQRWRDGDDIVISPVAFLTWFGIALFLLCVVVRFYRRTRRAGSTWYDVA